VLKAEFVPQGNRDWRLRAGRQRTGPRPLPQGVSSRRAPGSPRISR
jgi:hypothetical protein